MLGTAVFADFAYAFFIEIVRLGFHIVATAPMRFVVGFGFHIILRPRIFVVVRIFFTDILSAGGTH